MQNFKRSKTTKSISKTGAFCNEKYKRGGMTYHCRRNRNYCNCKSRRSFKRVSKDTT